MQEPENRDRFQKSRSELAELLVCSRMLMNFDRFEQAAWCIFESGKRITGAQSGFVIMMNEDDDKYDVLCLDPGGRPCSLHAEMPLPLRGIRHKVYSNGRPFFTNDFQSEKWGEFMPEGHLKIENILFVPLADRGNPFGVIGFANKPGGFDNEDVYIASTFGELVSVAYMSNLYREDLKRKEEKYRSLVETARDAIITVNQKHVIVSWNQGAQTMFGYTAEEVEGKPLSIIIPEQFKQGHEQGLKAFEFGEVPPFGGKSMEFTALKRDGREFPVELSVSGWSTSDGAFFTGIIRDISRRKLIENTLRDSERKQYHLAHHDYLTGLPNRLLFYDRLLQGLSNAHRNSGRLALLFLDLDRFKQVNDSLGHDVGDLLLQEVSYRLAELLRQGDTIARIGGDEFAIILPSATTPEGAVHVTSKLLELFKEPFELEGHTLDVSASVGIALYPEDGEDTETLLKNADIAMYEAKKTGDNTYRFFAREFEGRTEDQVSLELAFRQAVERNELVLHYQPRLDVKTGRIVCAEALLRWNHPDKGLLYPSTIIPLAEHLGIANEIDRWVFESACMKNVEWQMAGMPAIRMALNLSLHQLRHPAFIPTVQSVLESTGLAPEFLELQVTEKSVVDDIDIALSTVKKLKEMGIFICIDNFGTGFSSMAYLKQLKVDAISLDRSYTYAVMTDEDMTTIVKSTSEMADSLGFKLIVAGIETVEQMRFFRDLNYIEMQGYLFSKPVGASVFESMLQGWNAEFILKR